MIEDVERIDNVLYIKLSKAITPNDINIVGPLLNKMVLECKKAKIFLCLNGKIQYNWACILAIAILYLQCKNSLKHVAIISNDLKTKKNIEMIKGFLSCNIKFFDFMKYADAKNWIAQV